MFDCFNEIILIHLIFYFGIKILILTQFDRLHRLLTYPE